MLRISLLAALQAAAPQPIVPTPLPQMAPELVLPNLIEIESGRRLNLHCVGEGSPTVVFEQGGEGFLINWKRVQPAVAAFSRTCVYDRAGFGYSDPPREPVTGLNVTDDLNALLRAGRVQGPLVLVGHSVGGFYATLFANRFPEQVSGLVLVDPGFAGQDRELPPDLEARRQAALRKGEGYLLQCAELARTGALAPDNLAQNNCVPLWPGSTDQERPYLLHAILQPHWHLAEHSQSVHFFPSEGRPSVSWRQEAETRRDYGNMPMIVLSADRPNSSSWETEEGVRQAQSHWRQGHRNLAARSSRGLWRVVPGSGHFIQTDAPEAVVEAIREVVSAARSDHQGPAR